MTTIRPTAARSPRAPRPARGHDGRDDGRDTVTEESTADTAAGRHRRQHGADGEGVRLGIMAECEGAFGGFNEDVVAGATLALLINEAGATSNSPDTALDGFTGAEVAGIDRTGRDRLRRRHRRSRRAGDPDPRGAGRSQRRDRPLSGDEGIAIANYALDHPEVTFIDGISGAQDATLHVGRRTSSGTTVTVPNGTPVSATPCTTTPDGTPSQ